MGTIWWPPGGVQAGVGCYPDRALSAVPGESVGVSRPGHGCLRVACLGSAAGLCGRRGLPFPGSLKLELSRHITGVGRLSSGPEHLYFKTCSRLQARQLWVCSMLLLTAAAVGAAQPSAAKMRLDPSPFSVAGV